MDEEGGNILLYPNVQRIDAAIFAEGSVIPVDDIGSTAISDRKNTLANQLFIKGALSSWNTIGGANSLPLECPRQLEVDENFTCDFAQARRYDISYWRTYSEDGTGAAATDAPSNAPVIVQYDTRIQENAPPLFSSLDTVMSQSVTR